MPESYTKKASDTQRGMTLFELKNFIVCAEQAGIASGAYITGVTSMGGKQKLISANNDDTSGRRVEDNGRNRDKGRDRRV